MKEKKLQLLRNLTCIAIALLLLFTTAVFVVTALYQHQIDKLIDTATLLTDDKYPFWGASHPNNTYYHQVTLPSNHTVSLDFSYSYDSVAFGQGNQGTIKYLNQWKRLLPSNSSQQNPRVRVLNPAVEKLYGYEYYSPLSRSFTLNFNFLWSSVKRMVPNIYGLYLSKFYLQDTDTVTKVVLTPLGLPAEVQELVLNHPEYGWWAPTHLVHWFRLVHMQREELMQLDPMFQTLQLACKLTQQQMLGLVGKKSTLRQLSLALNGTIKNKVEGKELGYSECDPVCTEDQLVAIQLVTGWLSKAPLMGSLSLNKLTHQMNSSYPRPVEYLEFCSGRADLRCIDPANAVATFAKMTYNNFTEMVKVVANMDNLDLVENLFRIENPQKDGAYGESLIAYMFYLQNQVFNPYQEDTDSTDFQAYKLIFPSYEYLVSTLDYLQTAIPLEVISRAAISAVQTAGLSCHDFFTAQYIPFQHLCDKGDTDPTQEATLRLFVQAYLQFQSARQSFLNITGMSSQVASLFLKNDPGSLFASMMSTIQAELASGLDCQFTPCSSLELLAREWGGTRTVLDHLPKQYFPTGSLSLQDIDYEHRFTSSDPRYHKIMQETLSESLSTELLSDGDKSLRVLLNLLPLKGKAEAGDPSSANYLKYIQKTVIDTYFAGYYLEADLLSLFSGVESSALVQKQEMSPWRGGAPWLSSLVTLVEMKHSPSQFSKVNTGIYDKQQVRQVVRREGFSNTSATYTTFRTEDENAVQTLLSEKAVKGTNMLGFHQSISKDETLEVQLEPIYYSAQLTNGTNQQHQGIPALRFSLTQQDLNKRIPIGLEQLNQRFAILDDQSYFVIEPITGLTLALELDISIWANVTTMPFYDPALPSEAPLFTLKVVYQRGNTDSISQIRSMKSEMKDMTVILIVCAGASMVLAVVMAVLCINKRRKLRGRDIMNSLVSSEQAV